ncbi:MAG TPA: transposase, partial [Bryobacteraceae bacterium]|nr:transposase [Bryobacteraceae bacterium]
KNLTSIKGIGPLTGSILLSVIGDINDFADEGKLAAYFGIVPRVANSNETERSGRITKRGSTVKGSLRRAHPARPCRLRAVPKNLSPFAAGYGRRLVGPGAARQILE